MNITNKRSLNVLKTTFKDIKEGEAFILTNNPAEGLSPKRLYLKIRDAKVENINRKSISVNAIVFIEESALSGNKLIDYSFIGEDTEVYPVESTILYENKIHYTGESN